MGRHGGKGQQPPRSKRSGGSAPPPQPVVDDADFEVDEEDIAFIQSHKRQLSFLSRAALDDNVPGCEALSLVCSWLHASSAVVARAFATRSAAATTD
jgi:hypothetical protein